MIFLSHKKIYTRIIGIGRDLADVMERGKMDELCVCRRPGCIQARPDALEVDSLNF